MIGARDPHRARAFADEHGIPLAGTYDDLLQEPTLDAVYVPLPNDAHLPWATRALQAGKHALVEKPLTLDAHQARQLADTAQSTDRLCLEAFAYRFTPHIEETLRLVHAGELGDVRAVHGAFGFPLDRPDDFRWDPTKGGGALYDVGCYPVNVTRLLLGEPSSVTAQARLTERGVDVGLSGVLTYPDALATISCGFDWAGPTQALHVTGTHGTLTLTDAYDSNPGRPVTLTVNGEVRNLPAENGYTRMVQHFQAAGRGETPLRYTPQDAVAQARVLDALLHSVRTSTPVRLSPDA